MKKFKVSNFRLFNSDGCVVEFKPVTIFTGPNSSGKSSFVKAMVLMRNYLHSVREGDAMNPAVAQLDFTPSNLHLSNFDDAICSSCEKNDSIKFVIESTSNFAPCIFDVEYSFTSSPYSKTKGELESIKVFREGELLCEAKSERGCLSFTFSDLKGTLLELFLMYLKWFLSQESKQESSDHGSNGDTTWDHSKYKGAPILDVDKMIPDLAHAVKKYEETRIFFYFPLLERLSLMSKTEVVNALLDSKCVEDFISFADDVDIIAMRDSIVSEFSSSPFESFVDFYRSREDDALKEVIVNDLCLNRFERLNHYKYDRFGNEIPNENYIRDQLEDILNAYFVTFHNGGYNECENKGSFVNLCRYLHIWQSSITPDSDCYIRRKLWCNTWGFNAHHKITKQYEKFISTLIFQLLTSGSLENLKVVGNSFTPIQRLYSNDDKSSLAQSIIRFREFSRTIALRKPQRVREEQDSFEQFMEDLRTITYMPGSFCNKWLKKLGIASRLIIEDEPDGLGFKLYITDINKKRKVSLADQGHGITQIVSILLQIECEIMRQEIESCDRPELHSSINGNLNSTGSLLVIEEPEVSLHPSMQSKLALLFEDASHYGIRFIIETHSEYLVRRTQAFVANLKTEDEYRNNPFVVYYFNGDGTAYDLQYYRSGRFVNNFGTGFFDEAGKSSIEVLKRERGTVK